MRLLFLSPFPSRPLYGGSVVRNHYLLRWLKQNHTVWASFRGPAGEPGLAGEVPGDGTGWRALFDPGLVWRARNLIRQEKLEAIVASSLIAGLTGALLRILTGLPFWMDQHNVEWDCSRRYGFRGWPLVYLLERFILRRASRVTCVSEQDRRKFISGFGLDPGKVSVAPNGVDLEAVQARRDTDYPSRTHRRVLFFGVLNYPPNRVAVGRLATEIAPMAPPDMEFVVAGAGGEDLAERHPQLRFYGFVEDIFALVRDCDGLIVPIAAGGGSRLKILETIACGRPVLSTEVGAEGLDREALGVGLTVTDDPVETRIWLERLPIRSEVETGERFRELYDWESIWQSQSPLDTFQ